MHHTTMKSNHPLSDVVSLPALSTCKHNLEEGDQLVTLNALDVMYKNQQKHRRLRPLDGALLVDTTVDNAHPQR